MIKQKEKLEKEIEQLQKKIQCLPEGKLISGRNGRYSQWFQSDGHYRKYIPKKKEKLIQELAIKRYLTAQLEDAINEKRAIEFYLKHHREDVGKAEKLLCNTSKYREILSPYFKSNSKIVQEWQNEPYERNSQHTDNLIFKTASGNVVRSKSELIIDTLLFINKIPFRYECALKLGRRIIYPDFTMMHPKTGKIIYWEHFGLMDDEEYVKKACSKIQLYSTNGIIPSINLITTYETREHPLDSDKVMGIIEEYFELKEGQQMYTL